MISLELVRWKATLKGYMQISVEVPTQRAWWTIICWEEEGGQDDGNALVSHGYSFQDALDEMWRKLDV